MNTEILKNKILEANAAYRKGNPIMTDQEYDDLCDKVRYDYMSDEEWTVFRSSLFETAGKVQHPFAMGSLEKLKYEEPQAVCRWINEHVENSLNVSAKIDGISCRLHYEKRKLVSATTRGDGCLSYDSIIEFEDGRKMTIGSACELKTNGKVLSFNEKTKKFEFKRILDHQIKSLNKKWMLLILEDGKKLTLTEDHLVLTKNRGWIQAKELKKQDDVVSV